MNLEEWEIRNRKLVQKMESFYDEYQEKYRLDFDKDWVKANKEMCEKAEKKFKKEIKEKMDEVVLVH